ncbi:putative RNA-directed DNA polymerase [Tanacetum coccineum]
MSGILLSQKKYILELLQSAGLSNCNPVSSLMVTLSSLSLDDSTAFSNPVKYRQVVVLSQLFKRILRYLHGTVKHGMLIRRSSGSTLQAFTDVLWKGNPDTSLEAFSADWAGDSDDRRSTGGFAIYLGSNLISWTARKQRTVSRSSTEAEYKALADTVAELTWLQALLHELGIRSSSTPIIWCDNLGATYLSANPIFCARTKHVEIDYHFVREKVAQGDLRVQHISTHDQIAYIFTKPLPTPRFLFLRSKLQAVSVVSRYMDCPGKAHWEAGQWILRRSLTGYVFTLGGCAISWKATLQSTVALSTTKAEYMAMAEGIKEAIWLKGLVGDLGMQQDQTVVHCDSQSAIHLSRNQVYHERTKHIDVRYHFIREVISKGVVHVRKIHTTNNLVDMLTKPVTTNKFKHCLDLLSITTLWEPQLLSKFSSSGGALGQITNRRSSEKESVNYDTPSINEVNQGTTRAPPPPITRQRPTNLRQNPKQRVPYNPSANHAAVLPTTITEPTSFTVANNSPEWRQAMKEEYDALVKMEYGIDFHETFSPVVKLTTIQAVLSLAVTNNWPLRQLDVHNAFLHGNLKKQAPRAWFERLSKAFFDLGFKGSKTDPSLFIYSRRHTLLYTLVYVDDIIVTCNNKGTIDKIICQLGSAFALKYLRPLNYFLGIEMVPHVSGILLSQKKYILELLQSAGLSNCNPVSSPMVTSRLLSLDVSTAFSNLVKYRQVVGSLQYVTLSRPDIAFAVNKVCQYMHALTENNWSSVKQILHYLHGTFEHGMLIRRSSGSTLQAFTDVLWKGNPNTSLEAFLYADWAGDSDDQRSTGGFAIHLGLNLISWTARKQRTVSRSSTKAEYKALPLTDTVAELTWLQALLHELGIRSSSTPILWCDNLSATYLSANPFFCARTKHVEIDYHFVREKVAKGDLRVQHISTHDQIAYIFTKPLPAPRFLFLRSKLQVVARP